jgi:DNA invertase Pin-like site-specific DNA recombinase
MQPTQRISDEKLDKIRRAYEKGMSTTQMKAKFKCGQDTITRYAESNGWERPAKYYKNKFVQAGYATANKRWKLNSVEKMSDITPEIAQEVRNMYENEHKDIEVISQETGIKRIFLWPLKKAQNWTRNFFALMR